MWLELRSLKSDGLRFRKQSPIGPYVVDFACFGTKLLIEVDGDLHETAAGKQHDVVRDRYLRSLGFEILRFDYPDVFTNAWHVAMQIRAVALGRVDPTLKGEG